MTLYKKGNHEKIMRDALVIEGKMFMFMAIMSFSKKPW